MHGSILPETDEWDSFSSPNDYVEFSVSHRERSAIPPYSPRTAATEPVVPGLQSPDWNFRTMLHSLNRFSPNAPPPMVRRRFRRGRSTSIFSELEMNFWQKRSVYPYEIGIDEFVETLRARMSK